MARSLDVVALFGATFFSLCAAAGAAWWFGLSSAVLYKHGLLYIGIFAAAVGVPVYYTIRLRQNTRSTR